MNLNKAGWFCAVALASFLLTACTQTPAAAHASGFPPSAKQPPVRAIVYFKQAVPDIQKFSSVISEACHCQPVFIRPFLGDALIYEIALPPEYTFGQFEEVLMIQADKLGIRSVEQDSLMQHQ